MRETGLAVGFAESATCEGRRDVVSCDVEFAVGSASESVIFDRRLILRAFEDLVNLL